MLCKDSVRWLYSADANFYWDSGITIPEDQAFVDSTGKVRLIIETTGRISVTGGYAWNGCSPKFCFLDLFIGTPDGVVYAVTGRPKTYYASMVHDALYQFLGADSPFRRPQADACFLRLMADSEFSLRHIYWLAVRALGWLVWHGKRMKRQWQGQRLLVSDLLPMPPTPVAGAA
jgi:hypothetical protein